MSIKVLKKIFKKARKIKAPILKNNNKIIVITDGIETIYTNFLPEIQGLNFNISELSSNNVIKIELPINFSNSAINIQDASDNYIEIKSTIYYMNNFVIHLGQSSNMSVKLAKDISICGAEILTNQAGSKIEICEDCMIASGVRIVGCDGHTVIDSETSEIINYQKDKCYIGNHVWLGDYCQIMKNAFIPDNSVVGAHSVVTKKFSNENISIAGNPAKIIRENINWRRDVLTKEKDKNEKESMQLA